ncbi:MAG: cobalamin biosynthesis protein CbiX [Gammaproteobacteria bacterium]|nr:cobalamin biosynthesis protein CbiX [Gammaproteobacteria bacterium]
MSSELKVLLVDNGSIKPSATLLLRKLASRLSEKSGLKIYPVSLRHANRISREQLDGKPARTLVPFLTEQLQAGHTQFVLLPLLFGQSGALQDYVPEQIRLLEEEYGAIDLRIAEAVYPLPGGEPKLVQILFDHIRQLMLQHPAEKHPVVLVDHGSPSAQVTQVREHLATQLQALFKSSITIEQAVMERREGAEYDFNGPLLQHWLSQKARAGEKSAIVAMQFFLPGKHAGQEGDIESICSAVTHQFPDFQVYITALIGQHPGLLSILQARLKSTLR